MQVKLASILRVIARYKQASPKIDDSMQNQYLAALFLDSHEPTAKASVEALEAEIIKLEEEALSATDKKKKSIQDTVTSHVKELEEFKSHQLLGKELEVMKLAVHLDPIRAWPIIHNSHFASTSAMMDLRNIARAKLVKIMVGSLSSKGLKAIEDMPEDFVKDVTLFSEVAKATSPERLSKFLGKLSFRSGLENPVFTNPEIMTKAILGDFYMFNLVSEKLYHDANIARAMKVSLIKLVQDKDPKVGELAIEQLPDIFKNDAKFMEDLYDIYIAKNVSSTSKVTDELDDYKKFLEEKHKTFIEYEKFLELADKRVNNLPPSKH